MNSATSPERAYFAPFLTFLGLIFLGVLVAKPFEGRQVAWYLSECRYWVDPAQVVVCGVLLWRWRSQYGLARPRGATLAALTGILVFILWVAPQAYFSDSAALKWLGMIRMNGKETDGFNPYFFGSAGPAFVCNVSLRFLRLVVIVPFVEEIFWRGFLLRYLIDQNFTRVPFGTFSRDSFLLTTVGFMLEHQSADWPAAFMTGALFNAVAYRTKSLTACILAHAAANLLLGWYVLHTGQWGFW